MANKLSATKSQVVHYMLTRKGGATRAELQAVTGWRGGANLNVAAKRAGMKPVENKKTGKYRLVRGANGVH